MTDTPAEDDAAMMPRRTFPCNECPVRRDNATNPRAKFPAHRWKALRNTISPPDKPGLLDMPLFACHKGTPGDPEEDLACAGWLAAFAHRSIPARLAIHYGQLDPAALEPGDGWPELYTDWDEMAAAQQWNSGDPDDHLPTTCERDQSDATGEACVYYDRPGHTPEQKPDPSVYELGPDGWPLCTACRSVIAVLITPQGD